MPDVCGFMLPQHANTAILELLDTVSQPDDGSSAVPAGSAGFAAGPVAPRQLAGRRLGALSQHTAALCGRLSQRRNDWPADGAARADADAFTWEDGENIACEETAARSEQDASSMSLGPRKLPFEAGWRAGAGVSDGEASASADGEQDLQRVLRLVDDICLDLETGSAASGAPAPPLTSDEPAEVWLTCVASHTFMRGI